MGVVLAAFTTLGATECRHWADCEGYLTVIEGETPLLPGASVQFAWHEGGQTLSSPRRCSGYWHVDGVHGGNDRLGTVDDCGVYTAPSDLGDLTAVTVRVQTFAETPEEPIECLDCCPGAELRVGLEAP